MSGSSWLPVTGPLKLRNVSPAGTGLLPSVTGDYSRGMFSSIRTGVGEVRTAPYFIALADMPLVTPDIYRYLLTFRSNDAVIPKFHGKKGHPVLLSGNTRDFLLSLSPTIPSELL